MLIARRVAPAGIDAAGWFPKPSGRVAFAQAVHWLCSAIILVAVAAGAVRDSASISMLACVAILMLGLPHGTLDIALIRRQRSFGSSKVAAIVALYLGCAAAMYALWRFSPSVALSAFFILSIAHFSEDWAGRLPPFFAISTATALLTAPAFFYHDTLAAIFGALTETGPSTGLADVVILVAPVACTAAAVGIALQWCDGHRALAISTATALITMVVLPPVLGFALFFCLMHSPSQFSAGLNALGWRSVRQWTFVVTALTIGGLGIAALIFVASNTGNLSQAMITTAFVTLSVLTLPHMLVPVIVRRLA